MRRLEDGSFRVLVQQVWVVDHSRLLISMGGGGQQGRLWIRDLRGCRPWELRCLFTKIHRHESPDFGVMLDRSPRICSRAVPEYKLCPWASPLRDSPAGYHLPPWAGLSRACGSTESCPLSPPAKLMSDEINGEVESAHLGRPLW